MSNLVVELNESICLDWLNLDIPSVGLYPVHEMSKCIISDLQNGWAIQVLNWKSKHVSFIYKNQLFELVYVEDGLRQESYWKVREAMG